MAITHRLSDNGGDGVRCLRIRLLLVLEVAKQVPDGTPQLGRTVREVF